MLIDNGDGTFTGGQGDIICILELPGGTFHSAFFEEHPLPSQNKPIVKEDFLRLKSKMHQTKGSETFEEALLQLEDLRKKIILPNNNVIRNKAIKVEDPVNVWIVPNWLRDNRCVEELI